MDDLRVENDEDGEIYWLFQGEREVGTMRYGWEDGVLVLYHTQVDRTLGRRGLGSALVEHVLGEARERGVKIEPFCLFVRSYLERHPEHADLVAG